MHSEKITDTTTGKVFEGEEVDVTQAEEPWSTYVLADGTVLRAKLVAVKVLRLGDCMPDGTPIYALISQNLLNIRSRGDAGSRNNLNPAESVSDEADK